MNIKKLFPLLTFFLLIGFVSCKKESSNEAIIIKHCAGNFMKINGDMYAICNDNLIENYKNEEKVKIKYKIIDDKECNSYSPYPGDCYLYIPTKGNIKIEKISPSKDYIFAY